MATTTAEKHVLSAMDRTGDTKVEWAPGNAVEVKTAQKAFERLVAKGYMAYKTTARGARGEQLRAFDPQAERIVLVPPMAGG